MKKFFTVALSIYAILANAQNVGIGTPNPHNRLHVAGGFRLDTLTGVNGAGLLRHDANGVVYGIKFTGNTSDVLRGDGTFGSGGAGSVGWLLTGNSGTNPAINFLGTTDNQPLLFKVNNERHGLLGHNVFFGKYAGNLNDVGYSNIAIGPAALFFNSNRSGLVAIGDSALFNNGILAAGIFDAINNTAVGSKALYTNTIGYDNTAIGFNSLYSNQNGRQNTGVGKWSLLLNTTGSFNTALGNEALSRNTTGVSNTAVGNWSMLLNTTGQKNIAIGDNALSRNTTANDNTAIGYFALLSNTTGSENVAIGSGAMFANDFGTKNTAIGKNALSGGTRSENTAIGYKAMESNSGFQNTAVGTEALHENGGDNNTAIGYKALSKNGLGNLNVAIGWMSLVNTTGTRNIGIGPQAGSTNTNGSELTIIGSNANVTANNLSEATALGYGAIVNASNKVRLGGTGTTVSASSYIIESDGRFKEKISDGDVPGLSFIKELQPVAYNFNYKSFDDFLRKGIKEKDDQVKQTAYEKRLIDKSNKREIGFVAQDIEKLVKEKGFTFNGLYTPQNENDNYGLDYSKFVVPLVKAVQEQQTIITKQQKIIDELLKRVEALEKK